MAVDVTELPSASTRPARVGPAIAAALVIAASVAAQLPSLPAGFFSDDNLYVANNRVLLEVPLSEPWRFFTEKTNPWEYLPIRDLSYRLDVALFGLSPLALRIVNLALYALACIACLLATRAVLRAIRQERDDEFERVAVITAVALFAAHPAHVESVVWIASRKDVLSATFALAALWQFAEALVPDRTPWRRVALASALYALALLSKATVIPLAPAALLLALARFGAQEPRRAALRALAVAAPLLLLAAGSVVIASRFEAVGRTPEGLDPFQQPVGPVPLALRIAGGFAHVALAPVGLRLHYDVRMSGVAGAALVALGVGAVAAALHGGWTAVRRRSVAGFGVAWFGLFTVPFLQIVPFYTWSELCERWLFMPTVGLAMAAGAIAATIVRRGAARPVAAATAVLAAAGLALMAHRSWEWASTDRLVAANLVRAPGHPGAVVLAMEHWPQARHAEARAAASRVESAALRTRLELVADGWRSLVERRRDDARRTVAALSTMTPIELTADLEGALAESAGEDVEALRAYAFVGSRHAMRRIQQRYLPELERLRRALEGAPEDLRLLMEYGDLLLTLRLNADAAGTYRRIVRLAPALAAAHYGLALALFREGAWAEAAVAYGSATAEIPQAWNGLAQCEYRLGRVREAELAFRNALATDPAAWGPAVSLGVMYMELARPADARAALVVARERAAASDAPVEPIDALLERL